MRLSYAFIREMQAGLAVLVILRYAGEKCMVMVDRCWLMPPLPRRTPLPPLLAFAGHRYACPWFPARTIIIGLDRFDLIACSAFIARLPFVVTLASITVGTPAHTPHRSSGIIVDSFRAHPRLNARSRWRPWECTRTYLACDLAVAGYSGPCFRSRMACPANIKKLELVFVHFFEWIDDRVLLVQNHNWKL